MSPVLSPSVGGLGTIGNGTEMLGATLGPGVGSGRMDPGWDVKAGPAAVLGLGGTEVHTASMLALPGMATELQIWWGLQVSVDEVVLEKVPGAQGAHTTSDVAVPGVYTPKPGRHLRRGAHSRHPSCLGSVQYEPGLQVQIRFCSRVQAWVSTWSALQREPQLKHSGTQFQSWVYVLFSQRAHTVSEVLVQNDRAWKPGAHMLQHIWALLLKYSLCRQGLPGSGA